MLQDGQQLGEFEIIAKLGHGGMGAVFKARQTVLRRLVAIKTLQPSLASDAEFVSRFHNEAVAAAGLNHPNLVQVYAAGQTDGIHWFAMEFVDGESVDSRLKRLGKLEPAEALAICMHVCTALEYAWRKAQLIHRDIKPDNIFLSNDGEVKLGDLGLAKSSDQQQGLTMTGASMGTPLYISPEQAEGRRDMDLRTDIYSLGATLYHLLAGAPPYTAESAISVMMKHVGAPVPDIRVLDPSLPSALSAVLVRMMQKAPGDRYGSYEELGVDLQKAYAALSDPSSVDVRDSGAGGAGASGVAAKGLPKWLIPSVAVPLIGLGAFALWKSKGQGPGENASPDAQASTPASSGKISPAKSDAVPPPTKPVPAPPVQSSKPESQSSVYSPAQLLNKLEAKLLPVPGTGVLMSKTEVTVGEWKAYLNAQKLPQWKAPIEFPQTDAHPVVEVSITESADFCRWLSSVSGATWRLPTNQEWDAASPSPFPWGESFPPQWNEGNYALGVNGSYDSAKVGADGIFGTAPVASFKPNALGFYDLAGNVAEWVTDSGWYGKTSILRGAGWMDPGPTGDTESLRSKHQRIAAGPGGTSNRGFRVARVRNVSEKAAAPAAEGLASELVLRLESKLLPVPETAVLMCKTELTVGEWKLYLKANGLPEWEQPWQAIKTESNPKGGNSVVLKTENDWDQTDEHPLVVSWKDAKAMCDWLSAKTGRSWRMPMNLEWERAAGASKYPWGDYFPPKKDDGNYAVLEDGTRDPKVFGVDGIRGTARVGSFKPNIFGFYDLGGNVSEWMWDGLEASKGNRVVRGGGWASPASSLSVQNRDFSDPNTMRGGNGVRLVRVKSDAEKNATPAVQPSTAPLAPQKASGTPGQLSLQELVKSLEAKLIPVPGTQVRMCKTECTVGEWKLYLKAAGLGDWQQPDPEWIQADDHPVVKVTWEDVTRFSGWLSAKTGREWRLPTLAEWDAAVGKLKYPWGDYFPPRWDDGNFCFAADGRDDPRKVGIDGIRGTAPVASYKPNALGFYDLGGNAMEWMLDSNSNKNQYALRGGGWRDILNNIAMDQKIFVRSHASNNIGFRLVRK